jgi:hypothetical protein
MPSRSSVGTSSIDVTSHGVVAGDDAHDLVIARP